MKHHWRLICLVPVLSSALLQAEELAPTTLARILKLVLTDAKETVISCSDPLLRLELVKLGVKLDPEAKIAWVKTSPEKSKLRGSGRLTISGQVSDLGDGVVVALVGEGGRCVFYVSKANVDANKLALPTAIMKLGKVIQ
jgi:hypothetical protein